MRQVRASKNPAAAERKDSRPRAKGARRAQATGAKPPRDIHIPELFQILASCDSEVEQRRLYERLTAEGYECRVITL